ncbi:MAG: hypothetical protein CM15mV36_1220 [Caudoviricetes sp.]|nr:MAG: hypothetical protein CM15mV36_1220 [Caudoviricetes sp.]
MLSFKELQEKKSKVLINPKKSDMLEGKGINHGEDCDCKKCEQSAKVRKFLTVLISAPRRQTPK